MTARWRRASMRIGPAGWAWPTRRPRGLFGSGPLVAAREGMSLLRPALRCGLVSVAQVAAARAGVRFDHIPLEEIVRHPDNRTDLGDLTELVASIVQVGVLQPIVVDEAGQVLAERPDLAAAIGSAPYVLRTGERRLAAAREAGLSVISAVVHLTADQAATYATFFHENTHRKGLSAVDEARIVEHLKDIGLDQKTVAAKLGMSAPTVSRRLKLLTFPPSILELIHNGELAPREAIDELAGLPAETITRVWGIYVERGGRLGEAVEEVARATAREERITTIRSGLEAAGETVVDSVSDLPPGGGRRARRRR